MTFVLLRPLVAGALVAAACAASAQLHPYGPLVLGTATALVAIPLAAGSADAPRRVLWWSVAASGAALAARAIVAPPALSIAADPWLAAAREALAAPIRAFVPEPEAGIVLGIVLGERASIPRELMAAFAVTGTAHLLAISGSNMTLVASAVAFALRRRASPRVVATATLLAVAAYSALVGLGASVARAALMAAVTSLGLALGRPAVAANGLGAAVIVMLAVDPANVGDVGFQLSVAATAGLIAWQRPFAGRLGALPRIFGEALAATLAASLPTIPLVAAVFGRVSVISPVANLVAVPLFAPVMLFGAATAVVGATAAGAAEPLAIAAYASAFGLRRAVELFALIPGAALSVPPGPLTAVAITALFLGAWRAAPLVSVLVARARVRPPQARWRVPTLHATWVGAAVLAVAVLVGGAAAASAMGHGSHFRLRALDIGQGDAFLIETDGRYALIDGGPDPALLLRRLGEVLPPWQRRIDVVALTHEHADHGAGLLGVLDRYEVGLAIEPVGMNDVPLVRFWSEHLARAHVPRRAVTEGAVVRLGSVALHVLAPGRDRRIDVPSLVIRAEDAGSSVLFMGDAVDDAIADLLLSPESLRARVYVPPHHGAETTHAAALVAAARPEAAVISVGANNKYGHPAPSTIGALGAIPVYRTDRYGTVDVELDGRPLLIHTTKTPLPLDRGGPVPSAPAAR